MLQPNIVASPATFTMLAVCVLGIGFMVRFLIALGAEENEVRVVHQVRSGRVHYARDGAGEPRRHGATALDPVGYLAMGVLRITSALASNPRRESGHATRERSNVHACWAREGTRFRSRTALSFEPEFETDWMEIPQPISVEVCDFTPEARKTD